MAPRIVSSVPTALLLLSLPAVATAAAGVAHAIDFNVTAFGATGDRAIDQTSAIQAALDAAGEAGGGRVYLPAGDFLAGPIHLRSNVTLHLEAGATLWAIADEGRYYASGVAPELQTAARWKGLHTDLQFINGRNLENITISGRGRIHGQGAEHWWNKRRVRPYVIRLEDCRNVLFEGVTTVEAMFHTFNFSRVEGLIIRGVSLFNDPKSPNTDGFHLFGCRFVSISGVNMDTGDDCLVVGGGTSDLTVTNSRFATPWGVLWIIDGERITMTGCTVTCQMLLKDMRRASHVVVSDIVANGPGKLFTMMGGPVKNLLVSNVLAHDWSQGGWLEDAEDVVLDNIRISRKPGGGSQVLMDGFEFRRINGLTVRNVFLENIDSGPAIFAASVSGLEIDGLKTRHVAADAPIISLHNADDVMIADSRYEGPAPAQWLALTGGKTRDVHLRGNHFPGSNIHVAAEIPATALRSIPVAFSAVRGPQKLEANKPFTVSADVRSLAPEPGLAAAPLFVDGELAATRWLWLAPGERQSVEVPGPALYEDRRYSIAIGDEPAVERNLAGGPAKHVCEAISVTPEIAPAGSPVSVTATVRNIGSEPSRDEVNVLINGKAAAGLDVSLGPGEAREISFELSAPAAGLHAIAVPDGGPVTLKTYDQPIDSAFVHYDFEEVTEGRIPDRSGLDHAARLDANEDGKAPWLEPGPHGSALTFDGRTSFAEIEQNLLRFPMTLSLWIKPGPLNASSTAGRQMILYTGIAKGNDGYGPEPETHLMRATSDQLVWWTNNGARINLTTPLPPEGEFFHLAVVYDTTTRIYVDGVEVASHPGAEAPDFANYADRIYLGRPTVDYLRYFAGAIDELQMFNEPLAPEDIKKLAGK